MIYYVLMIGANQLITFLFYRLEKGTKFSKLNYFIRQLIIGIVFGIFGCIATECSIMVDVPLSNVRDSFPITAGLLFGGESGIISGLICGCFRFFSPTMMAGSYTRVSCSVTAVLSGLTAALMRKYLFKKKCPSVYITFMFVVSIEAFHMAMIFLTHSSDLSGAFQLVKIACFKVMIANSVSVALAVIIVRLHISKFSIHKIKTSHSCGCSYGKEKKQLSNILTFSMMFLITGAFVLVGYFLFAIHTEFAKNNLKTVFYDSLTEVKSNINKEYEAIISKEAENLESDTITNINQQVLIEIISWNLENYEEYMIDDLFLVDKNSHHLIGLENRKDLDYISDYILVNDGVIFPFEKDDRPEKLFETNFIGDDIYYMYISFYDYYILATVNKDSIMFFRDSTVYMVALLNIIIFSLLFFCSYVLLKTNIISNMRNLIEAMVKSKDRGKDSENYDQLFTPISRELNYTFKLLYKQYDELKDKVKQEHEEKEEFEYIAEHDKLTGLLNRNGFKKIMCTLSGKKINMAFLFIDVDKFKEINDTYGHIIGDQILKKIADFIKTDSRSGDISMRYGGDEFALIMFGCSYKDKEIIIKKITLINKKLKNPVDGLPPVTISVGVAFSKCGYSKSLLLEADKALYVTKENGRSGCFCSPIVIGE